MPGRLRYIGIDPPMDEVKRAELEAGELSRGIEAWERDPYGVGKVLMSKRRVRGWTLERGQRFWAEVMNATKASETKDLMSFLEWMRARPEEGGTYPSIPPWS